MRSVYTVAEWSEPLFNNRALFSDYFTLCILFVVAKNRSAAVLALLLGEDDAGIVGSDRYRAYWSIPVERRQVCWAHLKRNLAAFAERGGPVGDWGRDGMALVARVVAAWHRFGAGELDRGRLHAEVIAIRKDFRTFLERGAEVPSWQARALRADLLTLEVARWTFATVEGVEPTNNAAERA